MWKEIAGYEGLYSVNENGEVLSFGGKIQGKRITNTKILKYGISKQGYKTVALCKNKKQISHLIHRLVSTYFIPNPENKPCVNHINGIKTDNSIKNLEWVTVSENIKHAYRCLGVIGSQLGKTGRKNIKSLPVKQLTKNGEFVFIYESINQAELLTQCSHIHCCITGKRNQAGGFKWQFA